MTGPFTGTMDFIVGDEAFQTAFKVFGNLKSGRRPLIALHGGPGVPHQYMLPIADLAASRGIPIIFYDQVGCGLSTHLLDKPADFWTVELFIAELDNVLAHFGIADFDLYGHSWSGMLVSNYVIPVKGLKRLILFDAPASMELWAVGTNALLSKFPEVFQDVQKARAHAEYQQGIQEFNEKYLCTVKPWPSDLVNAFEALEADATVYSTMVGPLEFNITGTMKTWTVVGDLYHIAVPMLLINGRYDDAQDVAVAPFFEEIPSVKWVQFAESSHMPFFEEKERYLQVVGDSLAS
ncbi:proline-specific peptidase [Mycena epipterygia]|nr:proline-specific peptidase [Mycena epipterygia]